MSFIKDDVVLLMTGCIAADTNQPYHKLNDWNERLDQYVAAIDFYIKESIFTKIVFCDNSNFKSCVFNDFKIFAESVGKQFEYLTFMGDAEKYSKGGKGYGEGEIIEYALNNSELICKAKSFVKVTGRLKVKNSQKVFGCLNEGMNLFNRDIYSGRKGIDTRFYAVDTLFYKNKLLDKYHNCQIHNKSIEFIFWDFLITDKKSWRCTFAYPNVDGINGALSNNYSEESKFKIKLFSILCKFNLFNIVFPIYIAYRKVHLALNNKI